ncbi:MAG TPA: lantibiotic dehydratase [Pyrinomonadaceae bacterium]
MNETINENLIATMPPIPFGVAEETVPLSPHLIHVPGGEWNAWRCMGIRGAGFPASHVLKLASQQCAEAADELCRAEEELDQARLVALDALRTELDNANDSTLRSPLLNAIQSLKKGKLPKSLPEGRASEAVAAIGEARARFESALGKYRESYDAAVAQSSQAIHDVVQQNRFREAIIWQNRRAFHTGIEPLLRRTPDTNSRSSKHRQHEEMVATYLQRYCLKNDTIGFFGPMGWGRFSSHGDALRVEPGAEILEVRNVRFEGWCIDALAEMLSQDKRLRPWLSPRCVPFVHLDGSMLHLAGGKALKIGDREAGILRGCDGERVAKTLAAEMVQRGEAGSEAEVYRILEVLNGRGLITWTLEIPVQLHPEQFLRGLLERVEDEEIRRPGIAALDAMDVGRREIIESAGQPERLDLAFAKLETSFTELTGASATRNEGKTYAGRTVIYEDCRRDMDLEVGPEILSALGEPLSLLLTSARWFTYSASTIYRRLTRDIYTELSRKSGSRIVDGVSFWERAQKFLSGGGPRPADPLIPILQKRWANILKIPAGARRVQYSSEELRPAVMAAFKAPRPGWRAACYHSPDLMIAAKSVEAINRGDYQLVMGELHVGGNTFKPTCFMSQHPAPEELIAALDKDLPEPRLIPVTPKSWPNMTSRTQPMLISPKDYRFVISGDAHHNGDNSRVVPIGSVFIEDTNEGLVLRSRDGKICMDIVEACAEAFTGQIIQRFHILASDSHTPRVTIDRVTVCRETWRFPPAELSFAFEKDETARFLAARRFARAHDLPRFVFIKVPVEIKPFYVDFDSPIYVDILAKSIRRTKEKGAPDALVSVTEMHPRADETWLPDAEGNHYTSELRIVCVDPLS